MFVEVPEPPWVPLRGRESQREPSPPALSRSRGTAAEDGAGGRHRESRPQTRPARAVSRRGHSQPLPSVPVTSLLDKPPLSGAQKRHVLGEWEMLSAATVEAPRSSGFTPEFSNKGGWVPGSLVLGGIQPEETRHHRQYKQGAAHTSPFSLLPHPRPG